MRGGERGGEPSGAREPLELPIAAPREGCGTAGAATKPEAGVGAAWAGASGAAVAKLLMN